MRRPPSCLIVIGLLLGVGAHAESLVEGRVWLTSGAPAADVQVMLFDLTDVRRPLVAATTDETGHFALSEIVQKPSSLPERFHLGQNYPNPFNPATIIPFQLPVSTHVRLEVFNVLGQPIAALVDEDRSAGFHTARWHAKDAAGRAVAAGVYFYRLQAGGASFTHRMVLVDGQVGVPTETTAFVDPGPADAGVAETATRLYGLTVSGRGVTTYVNPAFRVDTNGGPVDLVIDTRTPIPSQKVAQSNLLGDVDNNGQVDISDAIVVALYIADNTITIPNNGDISLGDVNRDGQIDYIDVWLIITYHVLPEALDVPVTSATGAEKMYWIDYGTKKIQRADLDGSNVEDLVTTGLSAPLRLALDVVRGKMYWIDEPIPALPKKILRADLDGSNVEDVVTGIWEPRGLALDVAEGQMYWTDWVTDKIQRSDLDGSNVEDLVTTGLTTPYGLALDVVGGQMYWTDWGTDKIQRADLDGSNVEDLVTTGLSTPYGLALDVVGGQMYWTDYGTDKIQRADLDGSNVEDLVTTGLQYPRDVALDGIAGKMYWADEGTDKIQRANLDGTDVEDLVTTGLMSPIALALDTPVAWLSPNPSTVDLGNDGAWHSFTVHASEPVVVVANPRGTTPRVEIAQSSGGSNHCPAEAEDSIARQDSQAVYLAGCASGPGTVEVRRASDQTVLRTYTFTVATVTGASKMYWTNRGADKIQRSNLDGSNVEDLVTTGSPRGLALDMVKGKMYWTDQSTNKIRRADLDGSNIEDLVTSGLRNLEGLALDIVEGKMYWTDRGTDKIQRANLDGSDVEDLVTSGLRNPEGLALDVVGGTMYWTDWGTNKIQRADLDGSRVETLVDSGLTSPAGLALDVAGGKIYWTDYGTDKIQRADLDSFQVQDLITTGLSSPKGLALDVLGGKMYWTDYGTNKIQRADLDSFQVQDLVTTGLGSPEGLALDTPVAWLSPDPSTVAFYLPYHGTWRALTVHASEPVVVVANPSGTTPRVEITVSEGEFNDCPADSADTIGRQDGQAIYLAGCAKGMGTVELRRTSDRAVLQTYAFRVGGKMYWTHRGTEKIQRADLDGSNVEGLVTTGVISPGGLALDVVGDKMYWTDQSTNKIRRADLDGSNIEDLVTSGLWNLEGLALDIVEGKMYWTDRDTDKIQRANLDGSDVEDLVTIALNAPRGLALDVVGGKMYWTNFGRGKIQRADLDGSNVEDLVTGLSASGLALDVVWGKMYWTSSDKIQRADLDGSNVEDLVTTGLSYPLGLALDVVGGKMYWTDYGTDKIQRADLDGSNVEDLVTTGLIQPFGLALDIVEGGS